MEKKKGKWSRRETRRYTRGMMSCGQPQEGSTLKYTCRNLSNGERMGCAWRRNCFSARGKEGIRPPSLMIGWGPLATKSKDGGESGGCGQLTEGGKKWGYDVKRNTQYRRYFSAWYPKQVSKFKGRGGMKLKLGINTKLHQRFQSFAELNWVGVLKGHMIQWGRKLRILGIWKQNYLWGLGCKAQSPRGEEEWQGIQRGRLHPFPLIGCTNGMWRGDDVNKRRFGSTGL